MGMKTKIQNWRTNQIINRQERKAEREEEKFYLRSKVREAKESRRLKDLDIKAERIANRPSATECIKGVVSGFGNLGSSTPSRKKGKSRLDNVLSGFELGGGGLSLDAGTGIDLGFGSSKGRKKKGRRNNNFGGFI